MTEQFSRKEKFRFVKWSVFTLSHESLASASGQEFSSCNVTNSYSKFETVKTNKNIRIVRGNTHDLLILADQRRSREALWY